MSALPQALWFILPVFLAGLIHVAVIKRNWLSALGRWPLDFGGTLNGKPLFGDNKTLRGALVMIGVTQAMAALLAHAPAPFSRQLAVSNLQFDRPLLWGLLLGVGYIVGELPNSMLKRQLNIAPGTTGRGFAKILLWIGDQLDSLVGAILCISIVWRPTVLFIALLAGLTLILHPLVAALMVALGLKARVG